MNGAITLGEMADKGMVLPTAKRHRSSGVLDGNEDAHLPTVKKGQALLMGKVRPTE